MKITKKLEVELKQLLETYWDSYAKGDLQTWASFLPDNYRNIGTTQEEIWNSKEEIVNYTRAVIDQMVGNFEFRRAQFQIIPYDQNIMIHEFGDIYVRIKDEWAFYSKIRMSSLLQKDNTGWKIIHQHGSYPDSKTVEGEAFAFDTIKAENTKLREAVKHRTIELEQKNRELEIEGSLERVRAVAMGMAKPEDLLSVCEKLFKELQTLGFNKLRNAIIHILNDGKGFFLDYDYSDFSGGSITTTFYNSHPILNNFLKQIKSANDAFAEVVIDGNQLSDWKEFRRRSGQPDDSRLDNIPALYYYFYSIGIGDVGISTFNPIDENQLGILKRFRNVFELAYRRFMDIQKAEAQAREAQIEAALEKVRAVAMSMSKPDDLLNVCEVLFKEFQKLNFGELRNAMINIHNDEKGTFINYDYSDEIGKSINHLTYNIHPVIEKQIKQIRSANDAFSETSFTGKDLEEWKKFRQKIGEKDDPRISNISALHYYFYSIGTGSIGISTFNAINEEKLELLKRFRNVFSLSYQRYSDITLAEAQAKEAKIEAALERVRSRTMGMQKSEELKEVIRVVYEQFVHLKINVDHAGFVVDYTPKGDWHFWIADEQDIPSKITHPYFESVWANQFNEVKEKGADFFPTNLNFKEKNKFYNELLSYVPGLPDESKDFYLSCPGLSASTVLLENVSLYIENFSGIPYSDEENNTLMRFGKVFQQTYTRFLDLQKAEAQARESQIELGLERVRARAMAMQNSDELKELIGTVFTELTKLDLVLTRCIIWVFEPATHAARWWMANSEEPSNPLSFYIKYHEHPAYLTFVNEWKNQNIKFVYDLNGEDKTAWDDILFKETELKQLPYAVKEGMRVPGRVLLSASFNNFGGINVASLDPLSDEHFDILLRFAKVFDLTYTRFNDLKKAEAQAREAQIEAALERVRSKAMAMNSSEDLAITVDTFFSELNKLDIIPHRCGVGIVDPETRIADIRATAFTKENVSKKIVGNLKLAGHPVLDKIFENWGLQQEYHPVLRGNEISEYYKVMNPQVTFPDFADDEIQYGHYFHFKEGGVFAWTDKELKEEDLQIFRRYTSVLSLTYRRYAELKEAEAQAKEAKIEASLERVRSKAMAMHSPNDLSETVNVFFKELKTLGIIPIRCGVGHIDETARTTSLTTTTSSQQGESFQVIGKIKQTGHPVLDGIFDHWKLQKEYHPVLEGEDIKAYYSVMNPQIGYPEYPEGVTQYGNCFNFKEGFVFAWTENLLSEEELIIFRRFTSVLSLTYRRYMDLKEAEEQAREAQIEAALERTRTQSILMQHSTELDITSRVFHEQLLLLGIPSELSFVWLPDVEKEKHLFWTTWSQVENDSTFSQSKSLIYNLDRTEHYTAECFKAWESGEPVHVYTVLPAEVKSYFDIWSELISGAAKLKPEFFPEGIYYAEAFMKYGCFGIMIDRLLTEDEKKILLRFSIEFERTYTRFLDLKKAEEQNKIIQADNDRKTKELEDARLLQLSMLPKELPELPHLDIAVYMKTATEVGGDYYDFNVDTDGTLTVLVGDATGHGMMSGMMVSIMKSFFISHRTNIELKHFFENSNNSIKDMHLGRLMMASMGVQITSEKVIATNAGMPSLLYFRNKSQKAGEFVSHNLPLGAMKGTKYSLKEISYEKGDTLLLMSDGFAELKNENDEQYGYDRLKEEFKSVAQKSPNEIVEYLKNSASEWANGIEPNDDVTFVVIKAK